MGAEKLYRVCCRHCRVSITAVVRVGHEELDVLLEHVRACRPSEVRILPGHDGVAAILQHFDVGETEEKVSA